MFISPSSSLKAALALNPNIHTHLAALHRIAGFKITSPCPISNHLPSSKCLLWQLVRLSVFLGGPSYHAQIPPTVAPLGGALEPEGPISLPGEHCSLRWAGLLLVERETLHKTMQTPVSIKMFLASSNRTLTEKYHELETRK